MSEEKHIENKQKLYSSKAIAELVERFAAKSNVLDRNGDGQINMDDVKEFLDLNNDNEIDLDDLKAAFEKANNFIEQLCSFIGQETNEPDPPSSPESLRGPAFIDEPGNSEYPCNKCETYNEMIRNHISNDRNNNIVDEPEQEPDIENQIPKKKKKKEKLLSVLKQSVRPFQPRDKSQDKHIYHHYRLPGPNILPEPLN